MAEVTDIRTPADWAIIEADYRAGIKTLRTIAAENGLTEGAIRKRAKKEDWARDLTAKIREQADALVRKEAVRSEVRKTEGVPERVVVEANATMQYEVRIAHREDVQRARKLVMAMFGEIELQTGNPELFAQVVEIMAKEASDAGAQGSSIAKLQEAYNKVLSLGARVSNTKFLTDSLKNLIALEREAFGIDDKSKGPTTGDISISF